LAYAVFIAVSAAKAETASEWYGPEYRQCGDANTASIVQCVGKLVKLWEARLDAAFKKVLGLTEADRREGLLKAQDLWVQYRDANCGWYGSGAGTIKRIEASECMRSMTASRALELELAGETH
jgi:uncharacterized protein YecT (DUF1311 family)